MPLNSNYFNIISPINEHDFTNILLINTCINKLIYHYRLDILLGHKSLLDIQYMNYTKAGYGKFWTHPITRLITIN